MSQQKNSTKNSSEIPEPWIGQNFRYKPGNHTVESLLKEGAIQCRICGMLSHDLSIHIRKKHGMTAPEYREKYQAPTRSEKYKKRVGFKSGEDNPAFQHGGKLSPWSENFKHGYDPERHIKFKQEQSERWNDHEYRAKSPFFLEYWIEYCDGDEEKARELHSQSQTRDLNWFIEKYGEEEGKRRHAEKTEKWMKTLSSKTEEEKREIDRKKLKTKGGAPSDYEKILKQLLESCGFEVETQLCLNRLDNKKRRFYYDLIVGNKIIEVHGDYYHANPDFYTEDQTIRGNKVSDIWEKDRIKKETALEYGYEYIEIWTSEIQNERQQVMKKCINFLTQ